jgi:hypothetical protein
MALTGPGAGWLHGARQDIAGSGRKARVGQKARNIICHRALLRQAVPQGTTGTRKALPALMNRGRHGKTTTGPHR